MWTNIFNAPNFHSHLYKEQEVHYRVKIIQLIFFSSFEGQIAYQPNKPIFNSF